MKKYHLEVQAQSFRSGFYNNSFLSFSFVIVTPSEGVAFSCVSLTPSEGVGVSRHFPIPSEGVE